MSDFQEWCEEISSVVIASARGEVVQVSYNGNNWIDKCEKDFCGKYKYRIKPRTIKVGDFEVPEPITSHPAESMTHVYIASPAASSFYDEMELDHSVASYVFAERGICHKSKNDAIAHAKAIIALTSSK